MVPCDPYFTRLLHSPSLVALGLSVGYDMRHGLHLAGITLLRFAGPNVGWDCLSHNGLWAHVTGGNFYRFSVPTEWQFVTQWALKNSGNSHQNGGNSTDSPLAQPEWQMPAGRAVQRLWKSLIFPYKMMSSERPWWAFWMAHKGKWGEYDRETYWEHA